jgi:hypothetical protein
MGQIFWKVAANLGRGAVHPLPLLPLPWIRAADARDLL